MEVKINAQPIKEPSKPKKLVLPSDKTESGLDTYDLKTIFRANAMRELAGMDVTTRTPEVNAKLAAALSKTETQLGQTLAATIQESMFSDVFSSAQHRAEEVSEGESELEDCSPEGLM